jgi:hypothetical protein
LAESTCEEGDGKKPDRPSSGKTNPGIEAASSSLGSEYFRDRISAGVRGRLLFHPYIQANSSGKSVGIQGAPSVGLRKEHDAEGKCLLTSTLHLTLYFGERTRGHSRNLLKHARIVPGNLICGKGRSGVVLSLLTDRSNNRVF